MPYPYSYINYTGDGVTTDFPFPFDYKSAVDLHAFVDRVEVTMTLPTPKLARITAPGNGLPVQIRRITPLDEAAVTFTSGSIRDPNAFNQAINQQLMYALQEAYDRALDALGLGTDGNWDARTLMIRSGKPALLSDDYITYAQALQILADSGIVVDIIPPIDKTYQGDGVETEFSLLPARGVKAGNVFFQQQDLILRTSQYGVNGEGDHVVLNQPPAMFDECNARILVGQFVGTVPDGSITGDKIADRTIPAEKLVLNTITDDEIAAGAVGTSELADVCVTAAKIAAASIDPATDFASAVPHNLIAAGLPCSIAARVVGAGTSFWWGKPALQAGTKPRLVAISVSETNDADPKEFRLLYCNIEAGAYITAAQVRFPSSGDHKGFLAALIPAGFWYKLDKAAGNDTNVVVTDWIETDFGF